MSDGGDHPRAEIRPRPRGARAAVATPVALAHPGSDYFTDGREGTDRWGRERATLIACGTGWDGRICPLYVEEACPGDRNPGDRIGPNMKRVCDLVCGDCGGGLRTVTQAYCGQPKGQPMVEWAMAEMGGSLRLDQWTAPPPKHRVTSWPAAYCPVVETYAQTWELEKLPVLATTMQSAGPGLSERATRRTVRDRLGGYPGMLMVNGLVKDDMLDDAWDDRDRVFAYLVKSGVDIFVCWQISYYDEEPQGQAVYNSNRIFALYDTAVRAGFPVVALDIPPYAATWLHDEFITFARRSNIAAAAISYQTFGTRGTLDPRHVVGAKRLHEGLPPDTAIIAFGVGSAPAMTMLARLFAGRPLMFAGKEPYASAIFMQLMPGGASAPPGMTRTEVFQRNAAWATKIATHITDRAGRRRR